MKNTIEYFRRKLLSEIEEEKQMCPECYGPMQEGMCTECGYMEEKLVGGQKKLDVAPPFGQLTGADFKNLRNKKDSVNEKADMEKLEFELNLLKKQNPGKKVTYDFIQDAPNGYVFYIDGKLVKPGHNQVKKEGEDHEVSMAHSSLEEIIKAAQELLMKLGSEERDIPGWVQDHITNAENYIAQAAKGFHELDHQEEPTPEEEDSFSSMMAEILAESKSKKKKPVEKPTKKKKTK